MNYLTEKTQFRFNYQWLLPILLVLGLFLGYLIGELNREEYNQLTPYLKGLSLLEHLGTHLTVGIFFGLLILSGYLILKGRVANEPVIISLTILWSHWPDIRFVFRHLPHDPWEIIFFFHTVVDKSYWSLWIFLILDIALFLVYLLVRRKLKHKNRN